MAIGVTGARGVLGRRLSEAFETRGVRVYAFDDDVRDREALSAWAKRCERIIHAAAIVPTVLVSEAPDTAIAVNVAGTANVAAAASANSVPMTYISTSHVYASSPHPLTADAPRHPVSLYGLTKLQGEQWVERLLDKPLIIRIFSYFDTRQAPSFLIPALYRRIREAPKGAVLPLFGYRSVRDLTNASWLAEQIADCVLDGKTGTHNIGTGRGTSIAMVAERLAAASGREDISWVPADDHPGDTLVAASPISGHNAAFDLDEALKTFVAEAAAA